MRIDLHTHSSCSDGTETPGQVMSSAREAGLDVVALTDHDTIAGWSGAHAAAQAVGLELIKGIEVSCDSAGISVHLLAYLPRPEGDLYTELEAARRARNSRAERIVERLSTDFDITYADVVAAAAPGATIGRPHIADALVRAGVVPDRAAAFATHLSTKSPYYVPYEAPDPVRAVELVRAAGGVPVMAHPFASTRGRVVSDAVIHRMADAGLAGLEAHHRDHSPEQVAHAESLAAERGLFVTGSSDYHGTGKPNRLGENLTERAVLEAIKEQAR